MMRRQGNVANQEEGRWEERQVSVVVLREGDVAEERVKG
jgi:hypothetical protein